MEYIDRSAAIVDKWRYRLDRLWQAEHEGHAVFIGLNPSIADAEINDRTVSCCVRFANDWKCSHLTMLNLFAWRATKQKDMLAAHASGEDVIGPENDKRLLDFLNKESPDIVVAAWGQRGSWLGRAEAIQELMSQAGVKLQCLGRNQDGSPKHPSRLSSATHLVPFNSNRP